MHVKSLQSCPTLFAPMDCSPPGSSIHGILQARILEGLPCPPAGDLPNQGTEPATPVSPTLTGRFFTTSTTWEPQPPPSKKKNSHEVRNVSFIEFYSDFEIYAFYIMLLAFLVTQMVNNPPAMQETQVWSWVRKIPEERNDNPLLFLTGEFQGQRSLVGCSPCGHKESDTTEQLTQYTTESLTTEPPSILMVPRS